MTEAEASNPQGLQQGHRQARPQAQLQAQLQDDAPGAPSGWHPWLVLVLVLTLAPRAFDDAIGNLATRLLAHNPWRFWFPLATGLSGILGLLVAGILVDRYGVRIVAVVSLVAWACVTACTGAFVRGSPFLYLAHDAAAFTGLFFGLATIVIAKLVFPLARRARLLSALDIVAAAWLLGTPWILDAVHWPPVSRSDPAWAEGGLVIAAGAVLLAILWWRTRHPPAINVPAVGALGHRAALSGASSLGETLALLRRPGMIALVLVAACHLLVFSTLYRILPLYILRVRFLPAEAFTRALVMPLVAYAIAKLAIAAWSDARARRTGRPAPSRLPFIVIGAAVAATIGLFPMVSNASLGLIFWPLAFGMAGFPLVFTLGLDVVPAALAGRFFALAFAFALAVSLAAFVAASVVSTATHSIACYFYIAAVASLVGAVVAFVGLRRIEPVEESPALAETIGKVFT